MATRTQKSKKSAKKSRGPKYETLHELFLLKLASLHDIESQLIKALPKMAKAASNRALRDAFTAHLEETLRQQERIDRALELAGNARRAKSKVEAIRGLVKDAEWLIKNIKAPEARDAALIAAAQYVEHYEIAGYGSARAWSTLMGHEEITQLLQATLDEESAADQKLTALSEKVNQAVGFGMD